MFWKHLLNSKFTVTFKNKNTPVACIHKIKGYKFKIVDYGKLYYLHIQSMMIFKVVINLAFKT